MAFVEVNDVQKVYETTDGGPVAGLGGVSLRVEQGEFVALIGPSGCGKTTFLKLVGDLLEPTSGSIRVDGMPPGEARARGWLGYVFQNPVLLPWRRVIDNVRLPAEVLGREDGRDATALLELVGLHGFERRYPGELSGGMQQRVALARALSFDPKLLLMDEPFGALDELTRASMNDELLKVWLQLGRTVLFVTHSITEAVFLSGRVVVFSMRPGTVKAELSVDLPYPRDRSSLPFLSTVAKVRELLA